MLTIIPRSNILELNFVHRKGRKTMCFEWIGRTWIFTLCETKSVCLTWNNPQVVCRPPCVLFSVIWILTLDGNKLWQKCVNSVCMTFLAYINASCTIFLASKKLINFLFDLHASYALQTYTSSKVHVWVPNIVCNFDTSILMTFLIQLYN